MKKLLLFVLLLSGFQLFAQRFGIKAGFAMASYRTEVNNNNSSGYIRSNISTSFRKGWMAGGYADYDLTTNLMFRPALEMVIKGGIERGSYRAGWGSGDYESRNKFVAFDFPLNFLYRPDKNGSHFLIGGGPVPGVLIESGLKRFDFGINAVAGYQLANGFNASVSYNHGIMNVVQYAISRNSLRNQHIGFALGYSFRQRTATERIERAKKAEEANTPSKAAKAVYAELGNPGMLSFNYDTRLTKSNKGLGIRAGVGLLFDQEGFGFTLPVAANYLIGDHAHFFELAAGASFYSFKEQNQDSWFNFRETSFVAPFAWAGYRYQPPDMRFVFRGGFAHVFGVRMPGFLRPPVPSLSFGYSIR